MRFLLLNVPAAARLTLGPLQLNRQKHPRLRLVLLPMTIRAGGDSRSPHGADAEENNGPANPGPSPPMRMAASWSALQNGPL